MSFTVIQSKQYLPLKEKMNMKNNFMVGFMWNGLTFKFYMYGIRGGGDNILQTIYHNWYEEDFP